MEDKEIISKTKELIEKDSENLEKYLKVLALYILSKENENISDGFFYLANLLDLNKLEEFITIFSGKFIKVPPKKDYIEATIISFIILLEYKGHSFNEAVNIIKKRIPENYAFLLKHRNLSLIREKASKFKEELDLELWNFLIEKIE
jgi:hypothetical protein